MLQQVVVGFLELEQSLIRGLQKLLCLSERGLLVKQLHFCREQLCRAVFSLVLRLSKLLCKSLLLGVDLVHRIRDRLRPVLCLLDIVVYLLLRLAQLILGVGELVVERGGDFFVEPVDLLLREHDVFFFDHDPLVADRSHAVDALDLVHKLAAYKIRDLLSVLALKIDRSHSNGKNIGVDLDKIGRADLVGPQIGHRVKPRPDVNGRRIHIGAVLKLDHNDRIVLGGLRGDSLYAVNDRKSLFKRL